MNTKNAKCTNCRFYRRCPERSRGYACICWQSKNNSGVKTTQKETKNVFQEEKTD